MLCSDLLWDARSVTRKQVPTLQDALQCCNRETLLSMVEEGFACRLPGWEVATPQQRRVARKRMGRALDAMLDCQVKRKSGKGLCVFPEEHFVVYVLQGRPSIERVVQARVADLSGSAAEGGGHVRQFGCVPWSQALSYRVWLEGPWDCCERYMVLASAFWHLTHQSPSASKQEKGAWEPSGFAAPAAQPSNVRMLPKRDCAFVGLEDLKAPDVRATSDSVGRFAALRAASMGLYVPDALEETYQDRLISRVDKLNQECESDFLERVEGLVERLQAA